MTQKQARTRALYELESLQSEMTRVWLDESLPDDWDGLEALDPIDRPKTRLTIRLDSDVAAWFRKLGPGYQTRINQVLRVYWTSLMAGFIKAYPLDDTLPRLANQARRLQQEAENRRNAGKS